MKHSRIVFLPATLLGLVCLLGAAVPRGLDQADQLQAAVESPQEGFQWVRLESGVQLRVHGLVKNVIFYGDGIVRISANSGETFTRQPSLAVIAKPRACSPGVRETQGELVIETPKLRIVADKETGALAFYRGDGVLITRERQASPCELRKVLISGAPSYEMRQSFTLSPDESLYGLGQYNTPYMDYRGKEVLMVQTNIGTVLPMLLSTRRYGILWDVYSKMTFRDDANGAVFWAESAPAGVDYYLIAGDDMDGVIGGYRQLTGAAPLFPKQALGLFMSKERYMTQDRLAEVVRTFRAEQFPLDYIVQDWQYWGGSDGTWSGMTWDKARFPDPAGLIRTLHDELHVKLMVSIWPSVGNDTELARELDAKGLRFAPLHWISKQARVYDAYSEEGRAIYFKHIKKGLLDVGVDALWMDGTEVEVGGACHDAAEVERDIKSLGSNALGDFTRYLNPYSLETTKGTYEGQRATGNKRVLTLTRSAWAGQQRYAALPWSGDTTASWDTLRAQISGGLNIAMAGLPYWTQDTGGFFVNMPGGERNPAYRELYARWNQFGIFNPIYRIHGTHIEREPYLFKTLDPEVYRSLLQAAHLRYRLLPYLYSLAWKSSSEGYTMMRGLPMDFPDEVRLRRIDDAFMFGPAFLVHPVTRTMYHVENPPPALIATEFLRTPDDQPGLAVEYFDGMDLTKTASRSVDATVDHTWPGAPLANPPAGLDKLDNFSARWEGFLLAPEEGLYEIGLEGDDGYRLWLDGKLLIEDWNRGARRYKGTKLSLHKGQRIKVKIDYFQATAGRSLRLGWRMPRELRQLEEEKKPLDITMTTYLPAGADWYDFWTNERLAGGREANRQCPLDLLPLYVRAGSIVPMGPVMQYATEKPEAPYEIRIYPGADASFRLYEDDNETYNYEKGEYSTCELAWNETQKTLTVSDRKGTFPGMVRSRQLRVVLAKPGLNTGTAEGFSEAKTVTYTGEKLILRFD
jgi:alpha-D-xyloside xylohydrolase